MIKSDKSVESFAYCMSKKVKTISDRAIAFLYFHAIKNNTGATLKQIISDFKKSGLGSPNITKLKKKIVKDRRTTKISEDEWRIKSDKILQIEKEFQLSQCLVEAKSKPISVDGRFVNKERFGELKKKKVKFDFSRLIQMLVELDSSFSTGNFISVIFLIRAVLDHVPPIFNLTSFPEVANNYGSKSFKESMTHLENSSRKIADSYLHTQIRNKESLPNETQINFSNDLDVLLSEIIRIS